MALFGEKYGDVVRMVEIGEGEFSRELCGGTHVRSTAEIGVVRIIGETSSAANVRRIEALSGPAAVASLRARSDALEEIIGVLRATQDTVVAVVRARDAELRRLSKAARSAVADDGVDASALAAAREDLGGIAAVLANVGALDAGSLPDLADRVRGQLGGEGIVVLASTTGNAVVSVSPGVLARGVRADEVQQALSGAFGGGGGGRPTLARAGGGDPARIDAALDAARAAIVAAAAADGRCERSPWTTGARARASRSRTQQGPW